MKISSPWILAGLLLTLVAWSNAQVRSVFTPFPPFPGDEKIRQLDIEEAQVFFDARARELVIVRVAAVADGRGAPRIETTRVDVANPVDPRISVEVSRESPQRWLYRYTVGNGEGADRPIESWYVDIPQPRSPDPLDPRDVAHPVDRSGVWEFGHFAYRPGSWAMRWSRQPPQPALKGGGRTADFLVEADRRPGFLMAYFQSRREPVRLPEGLPEKLLGQLQSFLEMSGARPILTLGPKFRPDHDPRIIVADFHAGISRLARHGHLEADSPYVRACLDYLQTLIHEAGLTEAGLAPELQADPQTPLERSIDRALRLALELAE